MYFSSSGTRHSYFRNITTENIQEKNSRLREAMAGIEPVIRIVCQNWCIHSFSLCAWTLTAPLTLPPGPLRGENINTIMGNLVNLTS